MTGAAPPDEPPFDAATLEEGRKLFAQACSFMMSVAGRGQLPDAGLPEIAFAGRSNVGKSSLVNALTGQRTLARTSQPPARTRQRASGFLRRVPSPEQGASTRTRSKGPRSMNPRRLRVASYS